MIVTLKMVYSHTVMLKFSEPLIMQHLEQGLLPCLLNRDSITRFVSGNDVFVSLPTGAGKYMLLQLVFDSLHEVSSQSIIAVVSPLESLIDDQVHCSLVLESWH